MKTKTTLILLLFTTLFFGQNHQEGEIVISKPHLISLLQKFKNQKTAVVPRNEITSKLISEYNTVNNDSLMQRMNLLENKIASLRIKMDTVMKQTVVRDTVFTSSKKITVIRDTIYNSVANNNKKPLHIDNGNKNYEQQLNLLNNKYDALLRNQEQLLMLQKVNTIAVPAAVAVVAATSTKPVEKIETVANVNRVDNLVVVTDSLALETADVAVKPSAKFVSVQEILKEKYEKVQAQVFFDNNATKIEQGDAIRLGEVVLDLDGNSNLLVFLEGYSSKKGNIDYNNKLSLLRNDAVKQFLIENGISPKRILSQHHGVDTKSSTETMARRVDVSFVVEN
ncbi:OmpA family protein [Flavobacterium sp. PL002]|uniref:OmpA family protein n=1 Tax=Flavobacterium sp. PL002 TaxID=1897058 RepID=UPI001787E224|nr:OmpA family protein [Flavobacterium sp. PL002]MBE0392747.1 hypothetical protein [Flavobacterium sp. PL002]